ncbi:MmgE/PrpD family protein [Paraburkholderia sp. NPDC080076]|uniref:MmgE/PrpD family protein n=1 Tax=Paraburkholderia sp. NPDC080076 TaxID=3390605 RepID=UPI003CFDB1AA
MTIAVELAQFVTQTRYEDIPPSAIDYAAMLIASTVASAAMGAPLDSSGIVRRFEIERGGVADSSAWFAGATRLPVAKAARINAVMSDAAASDDSDLRNITHPGTPLVAAAIAMAEKTGADGKDVLAAIALGYEAAGRINGGVVPGLIWEKGFHGCMIAIFGAAVAAGLLLKLSAQQMTHALALAATSNAGLLAAANTSIAREYHAGLAAMLGVEAAQLAGLGYTAEETIFEHPHGFFHTYGVDAHASGRVAAVTEGLGETWQILSEMAVKLVPGAHPYHAMAEAAAEASTMANVPASEVVSIVCSLPKMRTLSGPRHPTDLIGAAHSPVYFAAASVADRGFDWQHLSLEKILDPEIRRLLDLVEVGEPPTENLERYKQGATVTVKTRDGRSFSKTVYAPLGSATRGVEWPDVERKFRALCPLARVSASNIDKSVHVLKHFRDVTHVRQLLDLLG